MVVRLALEAKWFAAYAFNSSNSVILAFNAIIAVGSRTALVGSAGVGEKLANLFFVPVEKFPIKLGGLSFGH